MKTTYLIQRLNKPRGNDTMSGLMNALSFGGGLINGGLSKESMELLRPIFSFDYMGAAEYEFGAVPQALSMMAKDIKNYAPGKIRLNGMMVYYICRKSETDEVEKLLMDLAKDKVRLKMSSHFSAALGLSKWFKKEDVKTIGWLELNNGFMFFTDEECFKKTCDLFEFNDES